MEKRKVRFGHRKRGGEEVETPNTQEFGTRNWDERELPVGLHPQNKIGGSSQSACAPKLGQAGADS